MQRGQQYAVLKAGNYSARLREAVTLISYEIGWQITQGRSAGHLLAMLEAAVGLTPTVATSSEEAHGAEWASSQAGHAQQSVQSPLQAPFARLLRIDTQVPAILVQRVIPGADIRPLGRQDDDAACAAVMHCLLQLHALARGAGELGLPNLLTLQQQLPSLAEVLAIFSHTSLVAASGLDPRLVHDAAAVGAELIADGEQTLLHGDLGQLNLLQSGWDATSAQWRAIDPVGYRGDPCFDAVAYLLDTHDAGHLHPDPRGRAQRRADIMAEISGWDKNRILAWAFVGAIIAELWNFRAHGFVAGAHLQLAQALKPSLSN